MAFVATGSCGQMAGAFPGCQGTVVTTGAGPRDRTVIESDIGPAAGDVAVVTGIAGWQMSSVLACCRCPVMAGEATADD